MTMMLRPLLPLLMLIPVIAWASAAHSAVPVARTALIQRAPLASPADMLRRQQAAAARIFTASVQPCVRTGSRMVC